MPQKDSVTTGNILKELRHGSVIIGCWNIQYIVRQMHTSVDIPLCDKLAAGYSVKPDKHAVSVHLICPLQPFPAALTASLFLFLGAKKWSSTHGAHEILGLNVSDGPI